VSLHRRTKAFEAFEISHTQNLEQKEIADTNAFQHRSDSDSDSESDEDGNATSSESS
jgi:hypothetical protein